jgi:hypothetical protein
LISAATSSGGGRRPKATSVAPVAAARCASAAVTGPSPAKTTFTATSGVDREASASRTASIVP